MNDRKSPKNLGAASRITALASSIMDLHVRIALKEVNREKRRLISGGIFLAIGGTLMLFTLLALEIICVSWMQRNFNWNMETTLVAIALINTTLAGISFRLGGYLTKGPYLPETLEGLSKSTKAVLGKPQ